MTINDNRFLAKLPMTSQYMNEMFRFAQHDDLFCALRDGEEGAAKPPLPLHLPPSKTTIVIPTEAVGISFSKTTSST